MSNFGLISCKKTGPPVAPLTDSMLLYLKFDTGDFSGNTVANWATGTAVYNVNLVGTILPRLKTTGQQVGSGYCDASFASGQSPDTAIVYNYTFTTYNNPLSISLWFKHNLNNPTDVGCIFDIGASMVIRFVGISLQFVCYYSGGQGAEINTPGYDDQKWHHVVVAISQSGVNGGSVYIDGSNKGTIETKMPFQKDNITIFNNYWHSSAKFNGSVDDVRVYTRILTSTEVTTIYNNRI
jgi:hypothetical protein